MKSLSDEDFPKKTEDFKKRYQDGESLDSILPEAFAVVREAAWRVIQERHYDVQLMGGMALHEGNIAEMQTGEGKTLSSTCPVYLNAISGLGVHVVTPNDYLAKRDSEWMGRVYSFLGLDIGLIQHGFGDQERKDNYGKDITYGTNNEFGFDYLRDNMKFNLKDYVQRDFNFAVVDEVDSILVDEARTPLIISGPAEDNVEKYQQINKIVYGLKREVKKEEVALLGSNEREGVAEDWETRELHDVVRAGDYSLDEKGRNVVITEHGAEVIEGRLEGAIAPGTSLFDYENIEILHHVNQALKAHYLFKKDVDYVVQNNQVIIVDEFTGRLMPGRRFSDGLHQALEAKENVPIERESQTLATITFQNYFRLYTKLSGMTGTAVTEKEEFQKIYNLGVVTIPTHRPVIRQDRPDTIYKTVAAKYRAISNRVAELHEAGQPVLVGTVSVNVSERLSQLLKQKGIPHEVLNAKHHEREAEIVSAAGQTGAVTIATNMAGRGTDIKPSEESLGQGGLVILGTERHDSRRIDNQLRGRSGRQGDPGESQFFLSLEDDLLRVFGGERISRIMDRLNIDEDEPIEHVFISKAIENAQKKVEGHHFSVRKHVLEYDDVMNRQRSIIYEQRREILSDDMHDLLIDMAEEIVENLMARYCDSKYVDQWDIDGFNHTYENIFHTPPPQDWYEQDISQDEMLRFFFEEAQKQYETKVKSIRSMLEAEGTLEDDQFFELLTDVQRRIVLEINDNLWKDHLLSMDHLRDSVGFVGYAQKKPIDEYKRQAFSMFSDLMVRISTEAITTFYLLRINSAAPPPEKEYQEEEMNFIHGNFEDIQPKKQEPVKKQTVIGRNDPCFCGSGKKYKKCHGISQTATAE